jgi:hypothetical protein
MREFTHPKIVASLIHAHSIPLAAAPETIEQAPTASDIYISHWTWNIKASASNPVTITSMVLNRSCDCTAFGLKECINKWRHGRASSNHNENANKNQ